MTSTFGKNGFGLLASALCLGVFISISSAQTIAVTPLGDTVLLHDDGTYQKNEPPKDDTRLKARIKSIATKHSATGREIEEAYSLALQGWQYTLPQPKSPQAAWGNRDGRTTWWYGYWKNIRTGRYSSSTPRLTKAGTWVGDDQNLEGYYRRGGSPKYPSNVELILSDLR